MIYVFIASVLPVHVLLQPRDFINSWQLLVAMGLLVVGVLVARPPIVADAVRLVPEVSLNGNPAPPMLPFLFITIACGAVSGFHCLVSSGCSSRQLKTEADAQYVGFGAMLTEGFLAMLVIVACIAGIGMGSEDGRATWLLYYQQWGGDAGLGAKLTPFIQGSANMIESIGVAHHFAITLMGVFVASFAATTLDSATRLQRYVIAELAGSGRIACVNECGVCSYSMEGIDDAEVCPECGAVRTMRMKPIGGPVRRFFMNRFGATFIAVTTALMLALSDGIQLHWGVRGLWPNGSGRWKSFYLEMFNDRALWYQFYFEGAGLGGLALWPIFGATNQLLAALALLVVTVWLVKTKKPVWVSAVPMVFMLGITSYAIVLLAKGFADSSNGLLLGVSVLMLVLEIWIVIEAAGLVFSKKSVVSESK
jgi:carbon starvation protein